MLLAKKLNVGLYGILTALLLWGASAFADSNDEWCDDADSGHGRRRAHFCEVREFTLKAGSELEVDATPNGAISIEGYGGKEIRVRARVSAWARSEEDAAKIGGKVSIEKEGVLGAEGPRRRRRDSWSVSYRIQVPHKIALTLDAMNGSIKVTDVEGQMDLQSLNGGIHLSGVSGDVRGRTTNGSLNVELTGKEWDGEGLDLVTTNGRVNLVVPENYNAHLQSGTTNGNIKTYFKRESSRRHQRNHWRSKRINTDLGKGGADLRLVTTNGSVRIRKDKGE